MSSTTTTTTQQATEFIDDEALAEEQLLEELEHEEIPAHIREARFSELKQNAVLFQEFKTLKHGEYSEIREERKFLDMTTSEKKCIVHFFHSDFRRCDIMDTHLQALAEKHFESKFSKINVDNAKFFVEKLKIKMLPAVMCFLDGVVVDRIIGFEELGNTDSFTTETLERRLGSSGVIDTKDLDDESGQKNKSIFGTRSNTADSESDDEDW